MHETKKDHKVYKILLIKETCGSASFELSKRLGNNEKITHKAFLTSSFINSRNHSHQTGGYFHA